MMKTIVWATALLVISLSVILIFIPAGERKEFVSSLTQITSTVIIPTLALIFGVMKKKKEA